MSKRSRRLLSNDDISVGELPENFNLNDNIEAAEMEALMQQLEERMTQITTNHATQMTQLTTANAA